MSSSHRSSHHSSSSKGKGHSSKSKSKKDDWSEITDPEERRRVQNRIAQRKFRDKAKESKEREDREAQDRTHAGHAYHVPEPGEMRTDDELSGLPWGSLNLRHVVSRGHAKEESSRRGSRHDDTRSHYGKSAYDGRSQYDGSPTYETTEPAYEADAYYETESNYGYPGDVGEGSGGTGGDERYYDYRTGSGSGHGESSR